MKFNLNGRGVKYEVENQGVKSFTWFEGRVNILFPNVGGIFIFLHLAFFPHIYQIKYSLVKTLNLFICRQFSSVCSFSNLTTMTCDLVGFFQPPSLPCLHPPHKYKMQFFPINQPGPIIVSTLTFTLAISNLVSLVITTHKQPFYLVLFYQPTSTLLLNLTKRASD